MILTFRPKSIGFFLHPPLVMKSAVCVLTIFELLCYKIDREMDKQTIQTLDDNGYC